MLIFVQYYIQVAIYIFHSAFESDHLYLCKKKEICPIQNSFVYWLGIGLGIERCSKVALHKLPHAAYCLRSLDSNNTADQSLFGFLSILILFMKILGISILLNYQLNQYTFYSCCTNNNKKKSNTPCSMYTQKYKKETLLEIFYIYFSSIVACKQIKF